MTDIHHLYATSLLVAYLMQFQNPTLLSSPLLSLLIGSMLARYFQVELASHQTYIKRCSVGLCCSLGKGIKYSITL